MDASDADNLTLLDRYVSDYKAYKFMVLSNTQLQEDNCFDGKITPDETEFTKMVSAYWAKFNDHYSSPDIAMQGFLCNKTRNYLSWETVENMEKALDENKILIWSFTLNNLYEKGHAVNIIGYDAYDLDGVNDTVVFDVYDSNYPDDTFKLKCKKIISSNGDESFTYEYITDFKDKYTANFDFKSDANEKGPYDTMGAGDLLHLFFVFDSDLNCLNVKLDIK